MLPKIGLSSEAMKVKYNRLNLLDVMVVEPVL